MCDTCPICGETYALTHRCDWSKRYIRSTPHPDRGQKRQDPPKPITTLSDAWS